MRLPSSGRPVKEPRVGLSTARTSSTNTATTSGVQETTRGTVPNAVTPEILAIIFRGIRSLRVIVRVSRVCRDWRVASKDPVRWLFPRSPPSSHLNTGCHLQGLWQRLCQTYFPLCTRVSDKPSVRDWNALFVQTRATVQREQVRLPTRTIVPVCSVLARASRRLGSACRCRCPCARAG